MKGIAAATVLLWMTTASVAEVRCQDAPGREQRGVYWSWREIEGKRCWFIGARGAMPPKSAFTWAKEKEEEPVDKDVPAAPENTKTGLAIQMLKVKPDEDLSDVRANWLDDGPVDLIVGEDLWGTFGVGGNWIVPAYAETAGEKSSFTTRLAPAR